MAPVGDEVGDLLELRGIQGRDLVQRGPRSLMRLVSQLASAVEAELCHVRALPKSLVAALLLAKRRLRSRHVEDVVDDLKQHAQLAGEGAERGDCDRFVTAG